jgi:hypothetical protein
MSRRTELVRMRSAFREITRERVEELIDVARLENERYAWTTRSRGISGTAATATYPGTSKLMTVESFVNSLPRKEQAELTALMVLGREPRTLSARGVELAADPAYWTCNLGQYLASKGGLARYLQEGMRVVGL